jgi:hypothetical protein
MMKIQKRIQNNFDFNNIIKENGIEMVSLRIEETLQNKTSEQEIIKKNIEPEKIIEPEKRTLESFINNYKEFLKIKKEKNSFTLIDQKNSEFGWKIPYTTEIIQQKKRKIIKRIGIPSIENVLKENFFFLLESNDKYFKSFENHIICGFHCFILNDSRKYFEKISENEEFCREVDIEFKKNIKLKYWKLKQVSSMHGDDLFKIFEEFTFILKIISKKKILNLLKKIIEEYNNIFHLLMNFILLIFHKPSSKEDVSTI